MVHRDDFRHNTKTKKGCHENRCTKDTKNPQIQKEHYGPDLSQDSRIYSVYFLLYT